MAREFQPSLAALGYSNLRRNPFAPTNNNDVEFQYYVSIYVHIHVTDVGALLRDLDLAFK